jgi:hypothetical protein
MKTNFAVQCTSFWSGYVESKMAPCRTYLKPRRAVKLPENTERETALPFARSLPRCRPKKEKDGTVPVASG